MGKEMPLYTENNGHYIDRDMADLRISQDKVRAFCLKKYFVNRLRRHENMTCMM